MRRRWTKAVGRGGFTLMEVMIATMITAALAVALINVALSTKTTSVKLDRKLLASQATKALQSALKAYVTGDPTSTRAGLCGPNTYNGVSPACNTAMWCISNAVQTDAQSGGVNPCYALNGGWHTLGCTVSGEDSRCVLPWALRRAPYNGTIRYNVVYSGANTPPSVSISVDWNEQ